jgi:acyl-CoA reductase-like NAD-dependent aldehyde dehydrogenase
MSKVLTHPGPVVDIPQDTFASQLAALREAQRKWAELPIYLRLYALRRVRHCLAERVDQFAGSIYRPGRSEADSIAAELLPVLDACKFLEREAEEILRTRREPNDSRPLWLLGVSVETRREPWGVVLIVAPSNFPLLLAGVQCLQALAAGNAVIWKPGKGGIDCAQVFAEAFAASGADTSLLLVTDESSEAAVEVMDAGVDKVILTGSAQTGRRVMARLASTLTPSVMELSGCDSVFILMDAKLDRVVEALAFSCRFNGSATCMAARRIFVPVQKSVELENRLRHILSLQPHIELAESSRRQLDDLVHEALLLGARLVYDGRGDHSTGPVLLTDVRPDMRIADADIFAPVLSLMPFRYEQEAVEANRLCSYALSVSIFGAESAARKLARQVEAGCVLINDLIAPTADPRVCFGGRKQSGFGMTRGRQGLLEMTSPKSVMLRRGDDRTHMRLYGNDHRALFHGYVRAVHGSGFRSRWRGAVEAIRGAITLFRRQRQTPR